MMEEKYEVIRNLILMMESMYGFSKSDYGSGMMHGIVSTLRALGLEADFRKYLENLKKGSGDGETVLSDRVE